MLGGVDKQNGNDRKTQVYILHWNKTTKRHNTLPRVNNRVKSANWWWPEMRTESDGRLSGSIDKPKLSEVSLKAGKVPNGQTQSHMDGETNQISWFPTRISKGVKWAVVRTDIQTNACTGKPRFSDISREAGKVSNGQTKKKKRKENTHSHTARQADKRMDKPIWVFSGLKTSKKDVKRDRNTHLWTDSQTHGLTKNLSYVRPQEAQE